APIVLESFLELPLYEAQKTFTLGNYARILTSAEFWTTVGATIVFAGLTTVLAVVLGIGLAVLLTRTDVPLAGLWSSVMLVPFYVSPLVLAFAWAIVYGPSGFATIGARLLGLPTWELYSLVGMAIVAGVYYAPYTYLYASASLSLSDPQLENAGRIAGAGPVRTLVSVTFPLLRPAVAYSVILTFVSAIEILSIPLVLGLPSGIQVLPTYLYKIGLSGSRPDYGGVAAVAVILLVVITGLVWLQTKVTGQERRFVTVGGKATRGRVMALGGLRWPLALVIGLYVLLGVVLPLVGIVMQSATAFLSPLVNPLTVLTTQNY